MNDELKPQFIYPNNPTLKKAYQALIQIVLDQRRVIFQPITLTKAILDYMGWIDDSNSNSPDKPPGPNYKKAKNILKTFEGLFTKFNNNGLEVFIFKADSRKRVSSFAELESLCALDPDMSELVATSEKLNLDQPWQDAYVGKTLVPMISEIDQIDTGIKQIKTQVEAQVELSKKRRLNGKTKGCNIPDEFAEEMKTHDLLKELGISGDAE